MSVNVPISWELVVWVSKSVCLSVCILLVCVCVCLSVCQSVCLCLYCSCWDLCFVARSLSNYTAFCITWQLWSNTRVVVLSWYTCRSYSVLSHTTSSKSSTVTTYWFIWPAVCKFRLQQDNYLGSISCLPPIELCLISIHRLLLSEVARNVIDKIFFSFLQFKLVFECLKIVATSTGWYGQDLYVGKIYDAGKIYDMGKIFSFWILQNEASEVDFCQFRLCKVCLFANGNVFC